MSPTCTAPGCTRPAQYTVIPAQFVTPEHYCAVCLARLVVGNTYYRLARITRLVDGGAVRVSDVLAYHARQDARQQKEQR